MKWIFKLLTFTSCSCLIGGDSHSEFFRTTYAFYTEEIRQLFSDLEKAEIILGRLDICDSLASEFNLLDAINSGLVYINSKIKRGTFNDNEGFVLILDDSSEIDIPGIIECSVRDIQDEVAHFDGKAFVFYMVPYKEKGKTSFDRALSANKTDERNKTMFMLQGADLIKEFQVTYDDRTARRYVERWFDRNKESGKKQCEEMSRLGLLTEKSGDAWEIINGEIISSVEKKNKKEKRKKKPNKKRTEDFYLRLTDNTEIKLIGVLKCKAKSKTSSSQNITEKYFTMTYKNAEEDINSLLGPISIDGKQIFALQPSIYDMLREQSQSTTPTKI